VTAAVTVAPVAGSNIAGSWAAAARDVPDRTALVAGDRRLTWSQFAERSRHLAWYIRATVSPAPGDRVAIALTNRVEYLETFFAALSLRGVPVNVSPRFATDEIHHVLDDSDAKLVVHAPELAKSVRTAARRIPKRWRPLLLEVGAPYEQAIAEAATTDMPPDLPVAMPDADDVIFQYERSGRDRPAGAIWRSGDLSRGLAGRYAGVVLVLAPLAQSAGLFTAISTLDARGTVVLVDPAVEAARVEDVWRAVERERVETIVAGSDELTRRLVAARDADLTWDLSSLHTITAWGGAAADRAMSVGQRLAVLDEETMRPVVPGSGEVGLVAATGLMPVGFWKDATRTAATFRTVDGTRYAIRGDHATVDADGTIHLVGSGTGPGAATNATGETFTVEDVERRLGEHASVQDCAVVGVPDDRAGELMVALVVVTDNHYLDEAELVAWCRTKLARHQAPTRFLVVETLHRSADGALDRARLRELAAGILDHGRE
jgi:fatty-acyl-CoA synthase